MGSSRVGAATQIGHLPAEASSFLAELHQAQARVLELLAAAGSELQSESAHLAQMSAISGRITRQLFDAQRSMLQREAFLDQRIREIGSSTSAECRAARATVAEAVNAGRPDLIDLDHVVPTVAACPQADSAKTTRESIVELAIELLRSSQDVETHRPTIEGAFVLDESDWQSTAQSLTAVLDEWWALRAAEHEVALADALARRRLELHIARLECEELVRAAPAAEVPTPEADELLDELEPTWLDDEAGAPIECVVMSLDGDPLPSLSRSGREVAPTHSNRPRRFRDPGLAWAG